MNMGTASLTREQLNEAIEQFADKIMEALGADVTDEEAASKPELSGTRFKAINLAGDEMELNAEDISSGTLVMDIAFEYFRCGPQGATGPWVKFTGRSLTHEEFAAEMRAAESTPRIAHWG